MDSTKEILDRVLDRLVPGLAQGFYQPQAGFQDPFGAGRRIISRPVVEACILELRKFYAGFSETEFVIDLLKNAPVLPPPIDVDYRPFKNSLPYPPHLVCFPLAFIKEYPQRQFIGPFVSLVVRTGWWAGDENCVDDILDALADNAEACRVAATSLSGASSPEELFAAGQFLYHLRYGEDWGLRGYVKEQYEAALHTLKNSAMLDEVRRRLKSGLVPWKVVHS